jgi:hypothetical protein
MLLLNDIGRKSRSSSSVLRRKKPMHLSDLGGYLPARFVYHHFSWDPWVLTWLAQQIDESKAMKDLNARIHQLTKLILTSQSVDEMKGDDSRPGSPVKIDFDMSPYQVGASAFIYPVVRN